MMTQTLQWFASTALQDEAQSNKPIPFILIVAIVGVLVGLHRTSTSKRKKPTP